MTVKGVEIAIWSDLECNISIICACVPSLNPLLSFAFPGLVGSSNRRSERDYNIPASSHTQDHYLTGTHPQHPSTSGSQVGGVKAQQSFEMGAVSLDESGSEKNLVITSASGAYHSTISRRE